jgi:hypothetical protein
MDYRGLEFLPDSNEDGLPESRGWPVMTGAQDSIAAAQLFQSRCPTIQKTVLLGVSMGGNASGLAVSLAKDAKHPDGSPLFDYWGGCRGRRQCHRDLHGSEGGGSGERLRRTGPGGHRGGNGRDPRAEPTAVPRQMCGVPAEEEDREVAGVLSEDGQTGIRAVVSHEPGLGETADPHVRALAFSRRPR